MITHPKLPGMRRGGRRKNAGRKPSGKRSRVSHAKRPRITRSQPVMITMRVRDGIPKLRNAVVLELFENVLRAMRGYEGFRVIHFSLQTNHIHLTVEADSTAALTKGMQSLSIRFAKALNRLLGRKGKVLADRYHISEMKTPLETKNKLAYVLCNANKHGQKLPVGKVLAPYSSAAYFHGWTDLAEPELRDVGEQDVVSAPTCWLLTTGFLKKHGPIPPGYVPAKGKAKKS